MTKPQNIAAIERATQREWGEWVSAIDALGGRELPHEQIVPLVRDAIADVDLGNRG